MNENEHFPVTQSVCEDGTIYLSIEKKKTMTMSLSIHSNPKKTDYKINGVFFSRSLFNLIMDCEIGW